MPESTDSVRAVIFDLGGVMATDMPWELIEEATDPEFRAAVKKVINDEWALMKVDASYPEQRFWDRVADAGHLSVEVTSFLSNLMLTEMHAFPDTLSTAKSISSNSSYLLALLSNHADFWFRPFCMQSGLPEVFPDSELVVVSCDVHCAKPDKEIYEIMLERLRRRNANLQASECVFIDDKKRNTDVAKEFGFRVITFNSATQPISYLKDALTEYGVKI